MRKMIETYTVMLVVDGKGFTQTYIDYEEALSAADLATDLACEFGKITEVVIKTVRTFKED